MHSNATTVKDYIDALPEDRRRAIKKVRATIRKSLPKGYEEVMNWGMITYQVPLAFYPDTYNGQPLMYAALASQKSHMAVYLTGIYMDEAHRRRFETDYRKTGKRFDVGKSCVRFRKLDDLPLELIGKAVGAFGMNEFVTRCKAASSARKSRRTATKSAKRAGRRAISAAPKTKRS